MKKEILEFISFSALAKYLEENDIELNPLYGEYYDGEMLQTDNIVIKDRQIFVDEQLCEDEISIGIFENGLAAIVCQYCGCEYLIHFSYSKF